MNGAEAIVNFLAEKGVKQTFGYPGGPVIVLFDAIYKKGFNNILTRHEQGSAHAAEGFAKASGLPGVMLATSGPGATNLVTGLADAYLDSVPVLAITGAVSRSATGTDAFQEADITGVTQPITKYNYLVMEADDLLPVLEEAWHLTTEGRPGPVLVNVPKDILAGPVGNGTGAGECKLLRHRPPRLRTGAMTGQVYAALQKSQRPLLLAGGGCIISPDGPRLLGEFADAVNIPLVTTLMGKGVIGADHPSYLGNLGMHGTPQANQALAECDLLLAVGSRFSDRIIGDPERFSQETARTVIHVDIDLAEIGKNIRTDIEIEDDAAAFFRAMLAAGPQQAASPAWQEWLDRLRAVGDKYNELVQAMYQDSSPLLPQYMIHLAAQRLKGQDPLVVTDVGQHQMFVAQHYPVESPRSFITSGGLGTMGFGLPAAVGAATAQPDRTTLLFTGDGGFQMTLQEMGTLAQENLPVKIMVMDNNCLGMVRQWQELFFDKRYANTLLSQNPDFVQIAAAYGIAGGRAHDGASFSAELEKALATPGPYLIHCAIDPEMNVYPMIPAGKMPGDLIMPGMTDD